MKNIFVLITLMFYSLNVFAQKAPVTSTTIIKGDEYYLSGNQKAAEKAYKSAIKSKDVDIKLWAAYRCLELSSNGKSAYKKAYEKALAQGLIDGCLEEKGTPNMTREEFYSLKNIIPLDQLTLQAVNTQYETQPNIAANQSAPQAIVQQPAQPKLQAIAQKSDVDINIPINKKGVAENTFVVIIANENYQEVAKVPYTINDGEIFAEYCKKTLGIPETNISLVKDATANNMKREIRWLTQILEQFKCEAQAIVYYAGHGIPDESTKDSYLLPVDGYGDDPTTGYSLNELYKTLNCVPSKSTLVFLDACFSGAQRDGGMLASARGVAIKAKPTTPQGNMVVFSAAQGDETAYPYKEKNHGLFTYYLLKKLQETEGNITLGELGDYITDQVGKRSIIVNRKSQTPTVSVSSALKGDWKDLMLK